MDAMRKPDGTYRTYDELTAEGIPTAYTGVHTSVGMPGISTPDPNTGLGRDCVVYAYAVMMAEVTVEITTGKITVDRFRCISDIGQVGSRQAVEGQAYSGIMHGIGTALSENYQDLKKHANILGAGFPYIKSIPDNIEVEFMDSYREAGPHGSSGCAESFQFRPAFGGDKRGPKCLWDPYTRSARHTGQGARRAEGPGKEQRACPALLHGLQLGGAYEGDTGQPRVVRFFSVASRLSFRLSTDRVSTGYVRKRRVSCSRLRQWNKIFFPSY